MACTCVGNFFPGVTILASYAVGETITKQQKILVENFAALNILFTHGKYCGVKVTNK